MAYRTGRCLLPQLLRERKITPSEFAVLVGMSKQQISDYTNNRKIMSLKNAKIIATELGVPIDDLYEWIEIPPSRSRSKHRTE